MLRDWGGESKTLWLRIYDVRVLTDDGIYVEGEVPEEYAGPELEIEYNQILVWIDSGGRFHEFRQLDYADLLDKDDKPNNGYSYTIYETAIGKTPEEVNPSEPGSVTALWRVEFAEGLDGASAADYLYKNYLTEIGEIEADGP